MENLNAENIKRGLACCKGSYDCFTCDIYKRGCAGWREGLAKDALALINSQGQRIKELTEENERLRAVAPECVEKVYRFMLRYVDKLSEIDEIDITIRLGQIAKEMLEGE